MKEGIIAAIVLGSLLVLAFAYAFAKEFESIADMKGHYGRRYFWFTFFFGPVGMLMVIALPDRYGTKKPSLIKPAEKSKDEDELPDL